MLIIDFESQNKDLMLIQNTFCGIKQKEDWSLKHVGKINKNWTNKAKPDSATWV